MPLAWRRRAACRAPRQATNAIAAAGCRWCAAGRHGVPGPAFPREP